MLAFCLTEVMDNQIRPLAFQVSTFDLRALQFHLGNKGFLNLMI